MNIKKLLARVSLATSFLVASSLAMAAGFNGLGQSFIGEYNGTYYDFSITHADPNHANDYFNLLSTTYMPWYGSGNSGSFGADAMLAAALSYSTPGLRGQWQNGNFISAQNSVYAINSHDPDNTSVYYKSGGSFSNSIINSGTGVYFLTATAVTGGANPTNNAPLNGLILDTASYTYSAGPLGGGIAPEMNASFIPQVGLMLGCLFFLLGRKKENTEPMLTA